MNSNPYVKYRHVGFSVEEFVKMTRDYPRDFIMYCEIVITENGLVFLASPSHYQIVQWLKKKGFKNCCEVWYNAAVGESLLTKAQSRVLNHLHNVGLINFTY